MKILKYIIILFSILSYLYCDPVFVEFQSNNLLITKAISDLSKIIDLTSKQLELFPNWSAQKGILFREKLDIFEVSVIKPFIDTNCFISSVVPNNSTLDITSKEDCLKILFSFNYRYHYIKDYTGNGSFYVSSNGLKFTKTEKLGDNRIDVNCTFETSFDLKEISIVAKYYNDYIKNWIVIGLGEEIKVFTTNFKNKIITNLDNYYLNNEDYKNFTFSIDTKIPKRIFNLQTILENEVNYTEYGAIYYYNGFYENSNNTMRKNFYSIQFYPEKGNLQFFISHHIFENFAKKVNEEGISFTFPNITIDDLSSIIPSLNYTGNVYANVKINLNINLINSIFKGLVTALIEIFHEDSGNLIISITSNLDYQMELKLNNLNILNFYLTKFSLITSNFIYPQINNYDIDQVNQFVQTYFSNYICENVPQIIGDIGTTFSTIFKKAQLTIVPYRGFIIYGEPINNREEALINYYSKINKYK